MNISDKRDFSAKIAVSAGLVGGIGIVLGAFGAHALKPHLTEANLAVWETGVHYQLIHAVALLALAALAKLLVGPDGQPPRQLNSAAVSWVAGVVLFSGSLYGLALGAPAVLGVVTPLGGLLFISGWGLVAAAGWRCRSK